MIKDCQVKLFLDHLFCSKTNIYIGQPPLSNPSGGVLCSTYILYYSKYKQRETPIMLRLVTPLAAEPSSPSNIPLLTPLLSPPSPSFSLNIIVNHGSYLKHCCFKIIFEPLCKPCFRRYNYYCNYRNNLNQRYCYCS